MLINNTLVRFSKLLSGKAGKHVSPLSFAKRFDSCWADGGNHATMNDLPIPEGDWNEWYHKKNSRYNMVLASGAAALIGSIVWAISENKMELNYTIPEYPDD